MANHIDQKWSGSGSWGSLAYIRAPNQTLAFKEKGGRIEKGLAQKIANKIGGKVNVWAGTHTFDGK